MDVVVSPLIASLKNPGATQLVRVASLSGFGLRDDSDGAIVADGVLSGRVLGGLCDPAILEAAADNDGRRTLETRVTDAAADAAGMVCGGTAHLLLSPIAELPAQLGEWLQAAVPVALVCAADGSPGDLVVTKREAAGDGEDDQPLLDAARDALAGGTTTSQVLTISDSTFLISTIVPSTHVVVAGSGPMAEAIAAQGRLLGWTVEINEDVDAGTSFCATAGPADGLIVLSHDRAIDVPLLDAALRSSIGYIGGMGSRGTQTARQNQLRDLGHDDQSRINGPIGLDLGSRNPAETAVAITAEFLANRTGRNAGRLTESQGPING